MLDIDATTWATIEELRAVGDHVVVAFTTDHRIVRISAERSLRPGDGEQHFQARYEQLVAVGELRVWTQVSYPWAMARTAQDCLSSAVRWVATVEPDPV